MFLYKILPATQIYCIFMLKKRNTFVHIYNEDEMLLLIRDSFLPAFILLEETLKKKLEEAENDWSEL